MARGRNRSCSRREFLSRAAALVAAPYVITSTALGGEGRPPAGNRITMGLIGVGGRGGALLQNFMALSDAQLVGVCDVKRPNRESAQRAINSHYANQDCAAFIDFRELLARPDIDAVAVATPDHWHVPHALAAVRAGKDVYCEKPLTVSIGWAKALREAVHRYARVFQIGTQERSSWNTRFACEMVRNQWVGPIKKVTVASRFSVASANYPPMPVPDGLDYDLWLGPAPWAPYTAMRVQNDCWFHTSDYTLGFISGCGIHTIDMANWGLGTDRTGPVEVEGTGEFPRDGLCNCATGWDVNLKFANGVAMNFTDGNRHPLGVKFEGTDGWVFVLETHLGGGVDAYPKTLLKRPVGANEIRLAVSNHHQANFIEAVKTRAEPIAPIDVAVRSDTLCELSDIAMRVGRKIRWDPDKEEIVGDAEASRMLMRPMRPPWHL